MWQPDGAAPLGKIGVLTPHLDPVPETEFQAMTPNGVSIHAARVPLGMIGADGKIVPTIGPEVAKAFSEPPAVDQAVDLLAPLELNSVVYCFTSSSYILGSRNDSVLKARLEERSNGIPVVIQTSAIVSALRALSIQRISLMHPPWYTPELDDMGATYFKGEGFEVIYHSPAHIHREYGDPAPEKIFSWAIDHTPDEADALVIGGGGFRAIGVVSALETKLDRPVITANQASFWCALSIAGISHPIREYGRIFDTGDPV
ncbi:MAG: hypothetical protein QNI91_03685 [Arenicellales bacterium]|nr:hypothetical protein [Arenicellales bacterium]